MYYDALGRMVKTVNPDDSEQRVYFGDVQNLSSPQDYIPSPWVRFIYDANDLASITVPVNWIVSQFTFGNNQVIKFKEFIYPLSELDYPLFGIKIYKLYYRFIQKFAHKRITTQELVVQGLSLIKPED